MPDEEMSQEDRSASLTTDHAATHSKGSLLDGSTIDESFSVKSNSLNFLRLILALAVVFSHSITLGMFGSESVLGKTTLGTVAVFGFFGISGYLIAGSATRNNVGRYLWQRFLRIFPAFWVCLIVTAFVFGTIAWFHYNPNLSRTCGIRCYVNQPNGPFEYVGHNFWLQVNQDTIGGTLPGGFSGYGWNGSLWTLELEFLCYVLLALLSLVGLLKRRVLVAAIAAGIWIAEIVIISSRTLSLHFTPLFGWDWITVFAFKVQVMELLMLVPIFLSGSRILAFSQLCPPFFSWLA
jgi:peptidoglycan/LPS O-acetylase OafA/YrhL